jgi:GNAT superfamily N-acetyltransferase
MPHLTAESGNDLRIKSVDDTHCLNQFIRLPWTIYRNDPVWVPPLLIERKQHLSSENPFFEHAKYRSWIAYRNGNPVGRISAQIDRIHLQRYRDATGFFGMLEAQNDPRIFKALMTRAETWLRHQGMKRILGPFNLSINQECGLLIEGFDTPPVIMTGHAPLYYRSRLERLGYVKEKDLLAYSVNIDFKLSPTMKALINRNKLHVKVRQLIRRQIDRDLQIIQDIFEDAWSENWGFVPFTSAEFRSLGRDLIMLVPPDFVQIAEVEGKPAAMIVGFPNIHEAIADLNGRLFPFGWLKLLWRLKVRFPNTARVPLMGIRKTYQKSRLGAALALMIIDKIRSRGIRRGIRRVELSWILEDNLGMQAILDGIGAKAYKRYRIFGKSLVPKPYNKNV